MAKKDKEFSGENKMDDLEIINLIKEMIKTKRNEYDRIPLIHTLTEINVLEELLTEIIKGNDKNSSNEDEDRDNNFEVFDIKSGKDNLILLYNKKDTGYYVKYKDEIIFDTRKRSYYRFKNTGKTWRYRDNSTRVELARGLVNISYTIRNELKLFSDIKVYDIKKLLSKMLNWIFLNEVPVEYRDKSWKEKSKIICKEDKK